jgi:putative membrane protein
LAERDCPDRSRSAAVQESSQEEAFLIKAAEHQKKEIALGALAREQAESPDVRQFAEIMIRDHARAAGELQQLASKEDIELPADSAPPQAGPESEYRLLDQSGSAFDRAYMEEMVRDHRTHVSEFEQRARQLTDPEVRRWASATLPVLKEHLRIAQDVATKLELDEAG